MVQKNSERATALEYYSRTVYASVNLSEQPEDDPRHWYPEFSKLFFFAEHIKANLGSYFRNAARNTFFLTKRSLFKVLYSSPFHKISLGELRS